MKREKGKQGLRSKVGMRRRLNLGHILRLARRAPRDADMIARELADAVLVGDGGGFDAEPLGQGAQDRHADGVRRLHVVAKLRLRLEYGRRPRVPHGLAVAQDHVVLGYVEELGRVLGAGLVRHGCPDAWFFFLVRPVRQNLLVVQVLPPSLSVSPQPFEQFLKFQDRLYDKNIYMYI